jgi:hypothetical protein
MEFTEFPKIARLSRECTITEKIDGTNGSIYIGENGEYLIGSRTQWITPERDNHGFAQWATEHKDELLKMGIGQHFGEWWGSGIQRGYGLPKGEKRWSLFNTRRWAMQGSELKQYPTEDPNVFKSQEYCPACCYVVPILYEGVFDTFLMEGLLRKMKEQGSIASKGFMKPEGIVIWHKAAQIYFKKTIEKDDEWKGKSDGRG